MARLSKQEQADILFADFQRWQAREANAYEGSRAGLSSYAEDRKALRGIGLVESRETRYSERWRPTEREQRFTSTTIDNVEVPASLIGNVVKVTNADGTITYRNVSSFRKPRNPRTRKTTATATQHRIMAADLAPIGNVD